ncbi:MAG TPA: glucose-1-phosphate adenylyltransferase subunit GlgD [Bacillales bacterium]|nr:glucose-1-phosphate adenylyltransferase subunit GlgD [Bacillales bacterium]
MNNVLGVINLINEPQFLKDLTRHRCYASVPFGGRYRLIDFTLSNFVRNGITKVGIFSKEKYRSLMDHVGSGREWDLDRHNGGLYILPPDESGEPIEGDLDSFHSHLEFFKRSQEQTVVLSPGHHVCKIDLDDVYKFHQQHEADITVVYKRYDGENVRKPVYHKCLVDDDDSIADINLFAFPAQGDAICLETYFINKDVLIDLVERCVENEENDFLKDVVKANLPRLKVKAYRFDGYLPFIHSIDTFYAGNLSFLEPEIHHKFYFGTGDIYTKVKHEAPAKYGKHADVSRSLIANGCEISGHVENSILFRGVKVKEGAVVKNSIIMQKGMIEEGVHLENVIADKQVTITSGKMIAGSARPRIIRKSTKL